jgi:hypothetical protein
MALTTPARSVAFTAPLQSASPVTAAAVARHRHTNAPATRGPLNNRLRSRNGSYLLAAIVPSEPRLHASPRAALQCRFLQCLSLPPRLSSAFGFIGRSGLPICRAPSHGPVTRTTICAGGPMLCAAELSRTWTVSTVSPSGN